MNTDKKIIIALDGFSSSGKSTMAKALARRIGYRYVDTGAMYRAVTLWAMEHSLVDTGGNVNAEALAEALPSIEIGFTIMPDGTQHTTLGGADVERRIRSMEVSSNVSAVAAIPAVRHALVAMQQAFGKEKGIVMDGRDIGTTVFPDAELKIFLNASAQTRARRRWNELRAKGEEVTFEEVLENVEKRDNIDRTRRESPLRRADDAIDLDNSSMTIEEQDRWLTDRFNETLARL
ncbi:(d)CMP kinase [Muribaculaceae bacterium Isolate-013 (NCI)]|nr:(d)CMP kinase [Muribaculaceae bacterium Isolate-013 (NCI)]